MKAHAVIEPIIIATNRQLSVVHPINKLLQPHYTDTMHINAITRTILISSDGALERTIFTSPYIMELNSLAYKNSWTFPGEAVPADLIQRYTYCKVFVLLYCYWLYFPAFQKLNYC